MKTRNVEAVTHTGLGYDENEVPVGMCQAIQEMRMEERRIGEQDGELKKAKEASRNLYNLGIDIEEIAQCVGYAAETMRQ